MAVVIIFNLRQQDFERREEIKAAIRLAIVKVMPEIEPHSGDIGFAGLEVNTKFSREEDSPVIIIIERLKGVSLVRGELEEEVRKYLELASPMRHRRVEVSAKEVRGRRLKGSSEHKMVLI